MKTAKTFSLLSLFVLLVTAWAQNPGYRVDPGWKVPPKAAVKKNPLPPTPAVLAGGKALFRAHCASCHGRDGQGGRRAADFHLAAVQAQSDGALLYKMSHGYRRKGMPSFSQLPEVQRWQIILYLRELGKERGHRK